MNIEHVPTDELLARYRTACTNLGKIPPGDMAHDSQWVTVENMRNELYTRRRALGLLKKAPLTGRKHQRPAFPQDS